MTDELKRMSFSQMCAALPEDFSWGDSLTPDVFQHIEDAILQAATPNGWKLVPIDPPSTLLDELAQVDDISYAALLARYRKMLAAVPILQAATCDAPSADAVILLARKSLYYLEGNLPDGPQDQLDFEQHKQVLKAIAASPPKGDGND